MERTKAKRSLVNRVAGAILLLPFLAHSVPALAADGKSVVEDFIGLTSQKGNIFDQAAVYVDFEEMSKRALGSKRWLKMSPVKRREFVATFRHVMEQRYYPRWHKIFGKGKMEYLAESRDGDDLLVKACLTLGKKRDDLTWRLCDGHGRLKIVSLAVGTNDLLTRASARLRKSADEKGTDGMIAWLKKKTKGSTGEPEPFQASVSN